MTPPSIAGREGRFAIVCGGRDFDDRALLFRALDAFHVEAPFACIFHGGARGADRLAGQWAASRDVPVWVFPAAWREHGRSAGVRRNADMLRELLLACSRGLAMSGHVFAFPGGRGTADMVRRAESAGLSPIRIGWSAP